MKKLTITLLSVFLLGFVLPQAEAMEYTPEQIKEMPRFSSIENQRCPSARYPSEKNRLACKQDVRIKIFEKRQQREKTKLGD